MKNKLSVVLATFNEERNIADCILSVKDIADEIIIFDESSSDKTRKIAKELGADVYKVNHEAIFHVTKQKAIDKASCEWILQMDADERLTEELREEICERINRPEEEVAYYIKRKNYFLGRWMIGSGMWPDPVIRLFRRGKAELPQKSVHEQMKVNGKTGTLVNPMNHLTAPSFSKYLVNANRYTTLTALELLQQKLKINIISFTNWVFIKPLIRFLTLYFRHKGFLDGFPGFIFDLYSGFHYPIAFFKYIQMTKNPETKKKMIFWR